jgi:tetratricopeptide (TPR) repeat protein
MRFQRAVTVVVAASIGLAVLAPGSARAQESDQDILTLKTLCEHGAWESAEEYAQACIEYGKTEALAYKAWALAGRAAKENSPKLLAEAKKALSEAKAKGSKAVIDLEKLPPNKFRDQDFEIQFAWTLKNRGRVKAAEQCIDAAMAGAGLDARHLCTAKTIKGQCYGDLSRIPALGLTDPAKRKEAFEKAKALFLEVAQDKQTPTELMVESRGLLYDLYYSRGSGLFDASKAADDVSQQESLRKESLEAFKAGADFLEAECKSLKDAIDKANATPPAEAPKEGDQPAGPQRKPEEYCLMYANHYWPKCLVGQAKAVTDKAEHDSLLNKAIEIYSAYNLDWGGEYEGKDAAIDMAEAYRELGNEEMAVVALESALSIEKESCDYDPLHGTDPKKPLRIGYVDEKSGKFVAVPENLDLFARASLVKAKVQKQRRKWPEALAALDKVFADAKVSGIEFDTKPFGKLLIIERAEALARTGKMKEANADLDKLIKEDETGATGQAARAMKARISAGGGGGGGGGGEEDAGVDSARAIKLMEDALTKDELNTATTWARKAIRLAKTEGKPDVIPAALAGLGAAYYRLGRYYEAAIAYDEVCHRYENAKAAPDAAQQVVICFNIVRFRCPNGRDKQKYEDALKYLTDRFPDQGKGFGDYALAEQYKEEGKFDDAAKYYEKVPAEAGDMYDKALYAAGLARYLSAQAQLKAKQDPKATLLEAQQTLEKAIGIYAQNDDKVTADRKAKRKDMDADARFLLADVLMTDQVNQPEKVLPLFEHASTDYEGNADRLSRAGFWGIKANLKLGRFDAAEAQLGVLLKDFGGQKRTILAAKEVAVSLDRDVMEKRKNKTLSDDDRRKIRVRISRYYARWILDGLKSTDALPRLGDLKTTANRMFEFGLDVSNQPEDGGFIQELPDNFDAGDAKQIFSDARDIYAELCKPENKPAWTLQACYGEAAALVGDWTGAAKGLEGAVGEAKLLDSKGMIDMNVLAKTKVLLAYYFDLGLCYEQAGKADKANYQKAIDVFTNVYNAATEHSKMWWKSKFEVFRCLDGRGDEKDYKELGLAIRSLERNDPDFKDAGKHGMQEKFQKLKRDLEAKGIK